MLANTSKSVFATLTPANVSASLAFHAAVEQSLSQDVPADFRRFMSVAPQKMYDEEVSLFLRRRKSFLEEPEDALSDTPTEYDTETEQREGHLGLIWKGYFEFDFSVQPDEPEAGWRIGRSAAQFRTPNQWCPASGIRNQHAIFNINTETGHMRILSRGSESGTSQVSVNGRNVPRGLSHALNQCQMRLWLGPLEFIFNYTDFASTQLYMIERQDYLRQFLGINVDVDLSPTPNNRSWTVGEWTIHGARGKGSSGRVYHATGVKGLAVAVKLMECSSNRKNIIEKQIETLKALTALAEKEGDDGRLLRLREVIRHDSDPSARWGDICLVLEPVLPGTLQDLLDKAKFPSPDSDSHMTLFFDALEGVRFLHTHKWLHGDLKPANIGVRGQQAVLLDLESAMQVTNGTLEASPGRTGTIGYLSPEREMQNYGLEADIWSLGVVGYQLIKGHHPWAMPFNPWRSNPDYVQRTRHFERKYELAMAKLGGGATSFDNLVKEMLRYERSSINPGTRITVHDAVLHPCWAAGASRTRRSCSTRCQ